MPKRVATRLGDTGGVVQALSYDRFGNMWAVPASQSAVSGIAALGWMPTAQSSFNAANNQLVSTTGAAYDSGAGNQTAFLGASLVYDAENRMVNSTTATSTVYSYAYDGLGQRVSRTVGGVTTNYVHDVFGNLAEEYNSPVAAACTTCYLSWDHLGSTRMVTDQNGSVVARHDYLPFGVEIPAGVAGRTGVGGATDGLSPKFTGQDHDTETSLEFYQARYLAGGLGRFLSLDPGNAGADATDPQSWNMYGYVRNSPLALIDPSGLDDCDPSDASCGGPGDPGIPWPVWGGGGGGSSNPGTVTPFEGQPQGPGANNTATCHLDPSCYEVAAIKLEIGIKLDLEAWAWGYMKNVLWGPLHTPHHGRIATGVAPQNPAPYRFFGTYYCGPGGAGPTGGSVPNKACAAHDACYFDAKIDADGNTNFGIYWSPQQVAAAKSCNQKLYDTVKGSSEPGATLLQLWLLYGDDLPIRILRPGTAAHR